MPGASDISEQLADAVRMEVAERFFGERKDLEDRIAIFHHYVEDLREIIGDVAARMGVMRLVTLTEDGFTSFWETVGVDRNRLPEPGPFAKKHLPLHFSRAFTVGGTLARAWAWAYGALREEVLAYATGERQGRRQGEDAQDRPSYDLIAEMCRFINDDVDRMNKDMCASSTLAFVRGLDGERVSQECQIGGIASGSMSGLDERLAFKPVDFEALDLPVFPELPESKKVSGVIHALARRVAAARKAEARDMLRELQRKIKG